MVFSFSHHFFSPGVKKMVHHFFSRLFFPRWTFCVGGVPFFFPGGHLENLMHHTPITIFFSPLFCFGKKSEFIESLNKLLCYPSLRPPTPSTPRICVSVQQKHTQTHMFAQLRIRYIYIRCGVTAAPVAGRLDFAPFSQRGRTVFTPFFFPRPFYIIFT